MELSKLLNNIQAIQVAGNFNVDEQVSSIEYDSRKVKEKSLFVAIKGFNVDGHKFITGAVNKGAAGIVLQDDNAVPDEFLSANKVSKILVENSREALADLSSAFYDHPSDKLNIVGITGTNGKTTVSYLIKNIFEYAGRKTGMTGTIANFIGNEKIVSDLTTPESSELNQLLKEMYVEGCSDVVMEVSSHSLVLKRVYGINFNFAVFTNITAEHLDFHHDFESYLKAKKIFFDSLSGDAIAIVNSDDNYTGQIISNCNAKIYRYGYSSSSDFQISDVHYDLSGTRFKINYANKTHPVKTSLVGEFNAYNSCAAFAAGVLNNINEEKVIEGIKSASQVPGRFEVLSGKNKKVVIDYSHTPDSLEKALKTIHGLNKNNSKVITVFGCGGNRDREKRPVMGRIAAELSDEVIITSDNPRFEDPFAIIDEIKKGINKNNFTVIENREDAIAKSIVNNDDAIILVAGKGHEDYQEVNGVRKHFSDKETVQKYLKT